MMASETRFVGHSGSVRGMKGGVDKILAQLREKSERLEASPVLQRLQKEETPTHPGGGGKIVVYTTSMQAVRDTFERCQRVVQVLRNFQVVFTSKDIYLHPQYNEELRLRLGEPDNISVPQLYIGGEYVGDAETVLELNEAGDLTQMLKGFKKHTPEGVCLLCHGQGFIVCLWCQGSKKGIRNAFNDLKCTVCNKNALQVCPECSL